MVFIGVILLAYGIIKAMFGYKLYRISLFLMGFFIGAVIGGIAGYAKSGSTAAVFCGLLLGIVCGVISVLLMKVGIFIQCFAYGFLVVLVPSVIENIKSLFSPMGLLSMGYDIMMTGSTQIHIFDAMPFAILAGIVLGILGVIFARVLIILSTGLYGGMVGGAGLCIMISNYDSSVMLIVGTVIAVLGIYVQFKTTAKTTAVTASQPIGSQQAEPQPMPIQQTEPQPVSVQQTEPINGSQETAAAKIDFSQQAAAAQAYAAQAIDGIKENGGKAADAIKRTGEAGIADLQSRQKAAMEQALSRKKDITTEEMLVQMESTLYQSKVMAWIMPFLEILTAIAALLFIVFGMRTARGVYGIFYGLEKGMPVFLLACLLGVVKQNKIMVSIVLGVAAFVEIVLGIWTPASFLFRIWLIALYIALFIWYNKDFFGQQMAGAAAGAFANTPKTSSKTSEQAADIFCTNCGEKLSANTIFCAKCGTKV